MQADVFIPASTPNDCAYTGYFPIISIRRIARILALASIGITSLSVVTERFPLFMETFYHPNRQDAITTSAK